MSETKRNVPKLRFPGFTEDWEQCKLSEVVNIRRGLTYKPSDISDSGIRVLRSSNIDEDVFVYNEEDVFVNVEAINIPCVKNGDILITAANGSSRLVGKHTIISGLEKNTAVHGGFMLLLETQEPQFIDALLSSSWYKKFINTFVAGGNGAIGNLNKSDLEEQMVYIPAIEEQRKIGAYYQSINNLITLHQRKLENLKLKKKALLQKLFPKNGEQIPELRFPGFTDDWEQRKLKHVVELRGRIGFRGYTEKDIISKEQGGILTFSPTNIIDDQITFNCKNTYITKTKYDESPEIKIINGDILFVKTGSTLGKSALVMGLLEDATINPQIVLMRPKEINPEFLANMMINNDIMVQVRRSKIGGAVPTLTETNIKEFDIFIPTEKDELNKIGNIFKNINQLITLHQRKLEHLQLQKKALLQQMFV